MRQARPQSKSGRNPAGDAALPVTSRSLGGVCIALGLLAGVGQLAIAFMGFAIGGGSLTIALVLLDALVAIAGAVAMARWRATALTLMLFASVGTLAALFSTTLLEAPVALLLLAAVVAGMRA